MFRKRREMARTGSEDPNATKSFGSILSIETQCQNQDENWKTVLNQPENTKKMSKLQDQHHQGLLMLREFEVNGRRASRTDCTAVDESV